MEEQNIIFDNYLMGKMSADEIADFEKELTVDDDSLKKDFEIYRDLQMYLKHEIGNKEQNEVFKENISNISEKYFSDKKENVRKLNSWHFLAIASSIIVAFGLFLFTNPSKPSYSEYAIHDNISLTVRGDNHEQLQKAEAEFNNGSYEKANYLFSKILQSDSVNTEIILYKAISEIELGIYTDAENSLTEISKGKSAYTDQAKWYLALSKLKQEKYDECLQVLNTISEGFEKQKELEDIIDRLE